MKKMTVVIGKTSGAPWCAEPEGKWWDEWDVDRNPFIDACREVGIRTSTLPPTIPRKKILALEAALRRRGVEVRIEASAQAVKRLDEERAARGS